MTNFEMYDNKPIQNTYGILNWIPLEGLIEFFQTGALPENYDFAYEECKTNHDFVVIKRGGLNFPIHISVWNWIFYSLENNGIYLTRHPYGKNSTALI